MHDFTQLLLSASMTMGTPLAVAKVLQVQPKLFRSASGSGAISCGCLRIDKKP
jgi:hypothetical protein